MPPRSATPRRIPTKRRRLPATEPPAPPPVCAYLGKPKWKEDGSLKTLKVLCHTCKGAEFIWQPEFSCEVYKRCLPYFAPTGEAADQWYGNEAKGVEPRFESALYRVCHGCESKRLLYSIAPPHSAITKSTS